ncbi:MAG: Cytochrome b5-like Heme/Steroid binding domain protein [Firmicutes bacterium]|nr:Cytochrome b5-like Heme/Steroid binding domain protein [Bacillota bacterium]
MKRIKFIIICFMLLSSVLLISCSKKEYDSTTNNSSTNSETKTFTIDELKTYDGQNGNPAYVAVDGIVYDVTDADGWNNGKHKNGIVAGVDLTSKLAESPHGAKVLNDLPVVGKLE